MPRKTSFVMYCENLEQVSLLSDTQAGKLFKALMRYVESGDIPEFGDGLLQMAFSFMSAQIRRDLEKWDETCQIRSEVGKKGGAPKGNRNAAKNNLNNQNNLIMRMCMRMCMKMRMLMLLCVKVRMWLRLKLPMQPVCLTAHRHLPHRMHTHRVSRLFCRCRLRIFWSLWMD